MNEKTLTVWSLLWKILKPYKWWYMLMLQAPIFSAMYIFANNYSFKLLIDAFSIADNVKYENLIYPSALFILAQIGIDISYRLSNIAEWKAEPLARRELLLQTYDYIQHHSCHFFQSTQSGVIISKLKGILEGYDYFLNLHHTLCRNFSIVVVSILVLFFC